MLRRLLTLFLCSGFALFAGHGSAAAPPRVLPGAIARLIQQLGSDDFSERQEASKALAAMGESAVPALSEAANSKDLEIRVRVKRLLEKHQEHLRGAIIRMKGRWEINRWTGGLTVTFAGKQVVDADLALLKDLTNLEELELLDTKVTDDGLEHLKGHSGLRRLVMNGASITDSGLIHLKGLANLVDLDLSRTRVGDSGLVHLKGLRLKHLDLGGTRLTDRGLAHLQGLDKLWLLSLAGTRVSQRGLANLQQVLPELAVFGP